jgi:hypothetical protein
LKERTRGVGSLMVDPWLHKAYFKMRHLVLLVGNINRPLPLETQEIRQLRLQ